MTRRGKVLPFAPLSQVAARRSALGLGDSLSARVGELDQFEIDGVELVRQLRTIPPKRGPDFLGGDEGRDVMHGSLVERAHLHAQLVIEAGRAEQELESK